MNKFCPEYGKSMGKNWSSGLIEHIENYTAYISVVFSWMMQDAFQRAIWLKAQGYRVMAGGPAVSMNPGCINEVADIEGEWSALSYHNPDATFTSRGCIRNCKFCAVPKIEGHLIELTDWEPKPIVCDNNLLACSLKHFDNVIDRLNPIRGVDFNQGLDARLLTKHHAERLAELDLYAVRLAWDHIGLENQYMAAFQILRDAGIPARKIRTYVLIGYKDTPDDALYRLQTIKDLGSWPNPMRYQPLDAQRKNEYVGENWTERELKNYMRYWSRLRWLEHIPFEDYST